MYIVFDEHLHFQNEHSWFTLRCHAAGRRRFVSTQISRRIFKAHYLHYTLWSHWPNINVFGDCLTWLYDKSGWLGSIGQIVQTPGPAALKAVSLKLAMNMLGYELDTTRHVLLCRDTTGHVVSCQMDFELKWHDVLSPNRALLSMGRFIEKIYRYNRIMNALRNSRAVERLDWCLNSKRNFVYTFIYCKHRAHGTLEPIETNHIESNNTVRKKAKKNKQCRHSFPFRLFVTTY